MDVMKNILILCGGNSCRSQMAEGFFKFYACGAANIYSAGIEAKGIHPKAVEIMAEAGIDLRGHTCNNVDEYNNITFDYLITVCDTDESCPAYPKYVEKFHFEFADPLAITGTDEEITEAFRKVRNEIKTVAEDFMATHIAC